MDQKLRRSRKEQNDDEITSKIELPTTRRNNLREISEKELGELALNQELVISNEWRKNIIHPKVRRERRIGFQIISE